MRYRLIFDAVFLDTDPHLQAMVDKEESAGDLTIGDGVVILSKPRAMADYFSHMEIQLTKADRPYHVYKLDRSGCRLFECGPETGEVMYVLDHDGEPMVDPKDLRHMAQARTSPVPPDALDCLLRPFDRLAWPEVRADMVLAEAGRPDSPVAPYRMGRLLALLVPDTHSGKFARGTA